MTDTPAPTPGVCYHPDPEINAGVIADALDAERADLAAGYSPRRWRCVCGAEHSRGHFETVGVHRCLACGYAGEGGVLLDDETAAAECRTADQIIHCDQVRPGDLMPAMREGFMRLWFEAERAAEAWAAAHPEASEPAETFAGCNAAPRCVNGPEPHAWGVTCRLKDAAWGGGAVSAPISKPGDREPITEYATQMSGGGMHVRWDDPEMERLYPIADFIRNQARTGGHVYRRRVVVVEDWEEVSEP